MIEGTEEGETCNRNFCEGIIKDHEKQGCCSCHTNPPCSYCTTPTAFCEKCDWSAREEFWEYEEKIINAYNLNKEHYEKQFKHNKEKEELFYKRYNGEIPAEKIEIRRYSHTNFSMRVIGVFPKGTETYESIRQKVRGTFGGRFTGEINKNSFKFEYIAYTD